jgi:very-short-patch-repair endonuclease
MRQKLQIALAQGHRREPTESEGVLWEELRGGKLNGLRFRRQHPVQFTRFIADFCCVALKLIVEIDGGYHNDPAQAERDREREVLIAERGYTFVRVSDDEVMTGLSEVLETIRKTAERTTSPPNLTDAPPLLRSGGGGRGVGAHHQTNDHNTKPNEN